MARRGGSETEFRILFSPQSLRALKSITRYYGQFSHGAAESVTHRVGAAIDSLTRLPERQQVIGTSRSSGAPIRRLVVSLYLVFYAVDHDAREVRIVDVRHGSRRPLRSFR